jgi:hypothetical protein
MRTVAIVFIVEIRKTFNTESVGMRRQSATNYCSAQNSHEKTLLLLSSKRRPLFKTRKYLAKNKSKTKNNCAGEYQQQITALHCWRGPAAIYCSAMLISQVIAGCCLFYTITKFI